MILHCSASMFRDAFTFVNHVIGGRKEMEYNLLGFEYLVEDDKMTLVGLSPEIHLHRAFPVESRNKAQSSGGVSQVVYAAVLADRISKFIRAAYKEGDVVLDFEGDSVEISMGGETIHLEQYDARKIQAARAMRAIRVVSRQEDVPAQPLVDALHALGECSATKGIRASMRHFELRVGRFLSSDGSRLRIVEDDRLPCQTLKISPNVAEKLHGALKSLKVDTFTLTHTVGRAAIEAPDVFMLFRLGDWNFPQVEENLSKREEFNWFYTGDAASFRKSLTVVSLGLAAGEEAVVLNPSSSGMTVKGVNGKGRETTSFADGLTKYADDDNEPEEPKVSSVHLLDTVPKTGQIRFACYPARKALLFFDSNGSQEVITAVPFKAAGRSIADAKIERMTKS